MAKPIEVKACCNKVSITKGNTIVMFGIHRFFVQVDHCKNCGSKKATSYINHIKQ